VRTQRPAAGFTLVEMLVAVALLAIIAVVSWRGLDHVAQQSARAERASAETADLLRTLAQLERDLEQRLPDTVLGARDAAQELPAALAILATAAGAPALEILRASPHSPGRAQRVVYYVANGALTRSLAPAGAERTAASTVELLPGTQRLTLRTYAAGAWSVPGARVPGRPPPGRATGLEITIEGREGARYVRVFVL
jgi:general secretion pathway protein J